MDTVTREKNSEYASIVLPNTAIKGVGIVTGFSGNILVFLLYTFWIQDKGDSRYFIPFLGLVDALGSLVQGTFYLLTDEYAFTFQNDIACRLLYFVLTSLSCISAHSILVIALQRYLVICRPFGRQMSRTSNRVSLVTIAVASCGYAIPFIIYSGVKEENISFRGQNFTAYTCRMVVDVSPSSITYVTFLFILTLVNLIATSFLYAPVCKAVYRATKLMRRRPRSQADANPENAIQNTDPVNHAGDENRDTGEAVLSKTNGGISTIRISLMFLIVIAVYTLSYVPSFLVILVNQTHKDFDPLKLTNAGLNIWRFFNTASFFNHIFNPFIYWYYDKKFRKALGKLCGKST